MQVCVQTGGVPADVPTGVSLRRIAKRVSLADGQYYDRNNLKASPFVQSTTTLMHLVHGWVVHCDANEPTFQITRRDTHGSCGS